jgi:hypothetical protein
MQDTLVHQRERWGSVCSNEHDYEGWWKAELRRALESWCWQLGHPGSDAWVLTEVKPREYDLGTSAESVDLVVGEWSDQKAKLVPPRIWIELKERGTWWGGGPKKALAGFVSDLQKWQDVAWAPEDIVVAGLIILHDAEQDSLIALPEDWSKELAATAKQFPMVINSRSVCYPCVRYDGAKKHRFATMAFLTAHRR